MANNSDEVQQIIERRCTAVFNGRRMREFILKPCSTSLLGDMQIFTSYVGRRRRRDRMSNLPDDLITRILSLLPTKDAVIVSVLSKRLRQVFNRWVTIVDVLDLDDSPISHCLQCPHLIERFPTFKNFVDSMLRACHSTRDITKYRLGCGGDYKSKLHIWGLTHDSCARHCSADVKPTDVNKWISFPLTRGVKELHLSIHVREPSKLPTEIFTCQTLEVLKLDANLCFEEVCSMPCFCLPNLKVVHLRFVVITDDEFVTRLVSGCPSLEDFTLEYCWWKHKDFITISSPSLRRLVLDMSFIRENEANGELVLIDAPNLQYLFYDDNLAKQYSVTKMSALVRAEINIGFILFNDKMEVSVQGMLGLLRTLSNVFHLSLKGSYMEVLDFDEDFDKLKKDFNELKNQLPVFHNLKYLELGCYCDTKWDILLLAFLNCSPFLQVLEFPEGICREGPGMPDESHELEAHCWRTTQAIPTCCGSHLKKIVIEEFNGRKRELDLVQFLLRVASVLEELVINCSWFASLDELRLWSTLKELPRASITCSIRVHRDPYP